jgi:hypothetical protein
LPEEKKAQLNFLQKIKQMEDQNQKDVVSMPRIGDKAPAFKAVTTQGEINFPEQYSGSWGILFSHPKEIWHDTARWKLYQGGSGSIYH